MKHLIRSLLFTAIFAALCYVVFTAVASSSLGQYLATVNPIRLVWLLTVVFVATCFVVGATTGDYSWVDRLWSLAPIIYGWIYAWRSGYSPWTVVAAVLVSVWGVRLTFNFARKGGFSGLEDYRWPILREKISNRLLWQLFNLAFICGFQVSLFSMFTAPIYQLISYSEATMPLVSIVVVLGACAALIFETIADQQQWKFHRLKTSGASSDSGNDDVKNGFLTHGLFSLSRHPAYFGELLFWWLIYVLLVSVSGVLFHWSVAGPLVLTLLFIASTRFTESISESKYAKYAEYKRVTSAIVPLPSRKQPEGVSVTRQDGGAQTAKNQ